MRTLEEYVTLIEQRLQELLPPPSEGLAYGRCINAMRYSLEAGGKRIRPVLVLAFCEMYGGTAETALDAACALEMIHTFSLIHDDMPCMDNDDMRRGKPSCHIAFDEATALLAGVALLNAAYGVIADSCKLTDHQKAALVSLLSRAVGTGGMIGGQVIDTLAAPARDTAELLEMYSMKTGALLEAACAMGAVCACHYDTHAAEEYARALGLAFQIKDDILDVTADEKVLGKPVHSDERNDKTTYVSLMGTDKAQEEAERLTALALQRARMLPENGFITGLTRKLLERVS